MQARTEDPAPYRVDRAAEEVNEDAIIARAMADIEAGSEPRDDATGDERCGHEYDDDGGHDVCAPLSFGGSDRRR